MVEWNATFIHVVFNYISVVGVPLVLFFLIAGYFMRSAALKQAALIGFAGLGLVTLFVATTGVMAQSGAVAAVEASGEFFSKHRIAGYLSAFLMVILGIWSVMGALAMNDKAKTTNAQRNLYPGVALVLAIVTSGVLFWTVINGTVIGHPEVVKAAPITAPPVLESEEPRQTMSGQPVGEPPIDDEAFTPTFEDDTTRLPASEPLLEEPIAPEGEQAPGFDQEEASESETPAF